MFWIPFMALVGTGLAFPLYTIIAERVYGQTIGKRTLNIQVVRETGARVSVGQAIVRQLPMFLQIYWIGALFALFTDKSQRAFELVSKTPVVRVSPEGLGSGALPEIKQA